jgi:hypothetical protein
LLCTCSQHERQHLKTAAFSVEGHEYQAIEQNPEKPSRWGQLARSGVLRQNLAHLWNQSVNQPPTFEPSGKILAMIPLLRHFVGWLVAAFRSREDLILENLALRQQLLALHGKRPRRRLGSLAKVFWVALRKLWSGWKEQPTML